MNRQEKKAYKRNNLDYIWETCQNGWIRSLFAPKFQDLLKRFLGEHHARKLFRHIYALRWWLLRKPILPSVEYVVTTRCTMNCEHCNTFVPYFNEKTHLTKVSFEEFKEDVDKLLCAVDFIYSFGFVGGEPTLNRELDKMIAYAVSKNKIKHVFLATNCTVIPNDRLLRVLSNRKCAVQISDYRHVHCIPSGIKVRYEECKHLYKSRDIKISAWQEKRAATTWQTMPTLRAVRQEEKIVEGIFNGCFGKVIGLMIAGGVVSRCTVSMFLSRNVKLREEANAEFFNIRRISIRALRDRIIGLYTKRFPEICHYCHLENMKYGLPCGEQISIEMASIKRAQIVSDATVHSHCE